MLCSAAMDLRSATLFIEGRLFDWEWDHERRLTVSQAETLVHLHFALYCERKGWRVDPKDAEKLVKILCHDRGYIIGLKFPDKPRSRVLPLSEPELAAGGAR